MTLNQKEIELIKQIKLKGGSKEQAFEELQKLRIGSQPSGGDIKSAIIQTTKKDKGPGFTESIYEAGKAGTKYFGTALFDIGTNIKEGAYGLGADISKIKHGTIGQDTGIVPGITARTVERAQQAGEEIKQAKTAEVFGEQGAIQTQAQAMGITAGVLSDTLGDIFFSGLKTLTPDNIQNSVKEGAVKLLETKGGEWLRGQIQKAEEGMQFLEQSNPEEARNYKAIIGGLKLASDMTGIASVSKVTPTLKQGVQDLKSSILKGITKTTPNTIPGVAKPSIFNNTINSIKNIGKIEDKTGILGLGKGIETIADEKINDLIYRGLKPSKSGTDTLGKMDFQIDKVKKGINVVGTEKVDGIIDALNKTVNKKKAIYEGISKNNYLVNIKTDTNVIAGKLQEYIDSEDFRLLELANPKVRNKFNKFIEFYSKPNLLKQSDLQTLKQNLNAQIPSSQWAKMLQTGADKEKLLVTSKILNIVGDIIDDNVEKALGTTNKALNLEYSAVRELEKLLVNRAGTYLRNSKGGLFGNLGDLIGYSDIAAGIFKGDIKQVGKGIVTKIMGKVIKNKDDTDILIKNLFKEVNKPSIGKYLRENPIKIQDNINKPKIKIKPKQLPEVIEQPRIKIKPKDNKTIIKNKIIEPSINKFKIKDELIKEYGQEKINEVIKTQKLETCLGGECTNEAIGKFLKNNETGKIKQGGAFIKENKVETKEDAVKLYKSLSSKNKIAGGTNKPMHTRYITKEGIIDDSFNKNKDTFYVNKDFTVIEYKGSGKQIDKKHIIKKKEDKLKDLFLNKK